MENDRSLLRLDSVNEERFFLKYIILVSSERFFSSWELAPSLTLRLDEGWVGLLWLVNPDSLCTFKCLMI